MLRYSVSILKRNIKITCRRFLRTLRLQLIGRNFISFTKEGMKPIERFGGRVSVSIASVAVAAVVVRDATAFTTTAVRLLLLLLLFEELNNDSVPPPPVRCNQVVEKPLTR